MANVQPGLTAGSVFGGYRIESYVARGGMGVIYKATQLALERTVALKLVAPELAHDEAFRERFKREAQLAASLDHPNILPVYEAGEIEGQLFLAMRYVIGTDLDSLIQREGALAQDRAIAIVAQVGSALDAAHSRGLVHRDVKPANILIAEEYGEERAYLTDFGLTKNVATGAHLTRTGYVVGTLDYVAPEQVQGGSVDGRVDTYALACVLYRAVTGSVPFDRPGDVAKMWAHLNDPPPSAATVSPAVSAELDAVIRRGMAKRPEDRYPSSGEFGRAARAAVASAAPGQPARTELDVTQVDHAFDAPVRPVTPGPAPRVAPEDAAILERSPPAVSGRCGGGARGRRRGRDRLGRQFSEGRHCDFQPGGPGDDAVDAVDDCQHRDLDDGDILGDRAGGRLPRAGSQHHPAHERGVPVGSRGVPISAGRCSTARRCRSPPACAASRTSSTPCRRRHRSWSITRRS